MVAVAVGGSEGFDLCVCMGGGADDYFYFQDESGIADSNLDVLLCVL